MRVGLFKVFGFLMVFSLLSGCGMSKEDISETVKNSMQETLRNDSDLGQYSLNVESVQVFERSDDYYKGMVSIGYRGVSHDVSVDVWVDGNDVMWETAPGAFMFVAQDQLQNLFR